MKRWVYVMVAAVVLTACEPQPVEQEAVGPSPIASFDKTRLWILVRAARLGDGRKCADYYRAPDDVRYRGLAQSCEAWTLNFADYLRINGLPTIEAAHLRDLVYWEWFETTKQTIQDCTSQYVPRGFQKRTGAEVQAERTNRNACDPYDDALNNNKQTPEDLGVRFK